MKPFKSGTFLATWLLRFLLAWFVFKNYAYTFADFDFNNFNFYVSAVYLLGAVLLIIAGFMKNTSLTVLTGLTLFVLPIVQLIRNFPADFSNQLLIFLLPIACGFYFFSSGNQS